MLLFEVLASGTFLDNLPIVEKLETGSGLASRQFLERITRSGLCPSEEVTVDTGTSRFASVKSQ